MSDEADRDRLVAETASQLFPGLEDPLLTQVHELLSPLVVDWVEQAEGLDQSVVLGIGRADLAAKLGDGTPAERVSRLRDEVTARRVEQVAARVSALARELNADASELDRLEGDLTELRSRVSAVGDGAVRLRLGRELERAGLDLGSVRHGEPVR